MKSFATFAALLAAFAVATPTPQAGSGGCKTYTLLFARGTTETGTLGTVVGPGLQKAVESALGADQVSTQGIAYAADMGGIMSESTGSGPGSVAMTKAAQSALSSCPSTKLILTGYSQGAMVVHNSAKQLGGQASSVGAGVTFGDPFKTQLPSGISAAKFHTFCASGDSVCGTGGSCAGTGGCTSKSTSGHLGYGSDVTAAADFIKSALKA